MYWILNSQSIGFGARQNELIELSLTYKFAGFDIDINEFHSQAQAQGMDYAKRFIASAPVTLGAFDLPVRWQDEVVEFKIDLSNLDAVCQTAVSIGARTCVTTVLPYSEQRPYHESFELARERLGEIGDVLHKHGIRLGVKFLGAAHHREGKSESFITKPDELVTLVKTVSNPAVGLCLDAWDWHVAGGTLDQIKEIDPNHIVVVQVADLPEGADLATVAEDQRLLPGATGVVPVTGLIEYLKAKDYKGAVVPYCHPSQFPSRNKNTTVSSIRTAIERTINPPPPVEEPSESDTAADAAADSKDTPTEAIATS
ncbi:sugar phosphate isomerase/epimerase family protein [Planctomycetota bacterium]